MLSLDLHPIFRSNRDLDTALRTFLVRAAASGEQTVEIVPGKGSAALRQRVLTFLAQPHVRKLYRSAEVDARNPGRVLVHLR
ncbi:Smr/MutS family protein [Kineococcus radiotolerans]|uniref:Smr protein/MutS2 n=1 Tax=Kineococcus radiotolerans (strain ATCC BAA-149 / DSM 14245 / SRS30216) TaxID=266940 RepID=A6W4W5_KINRD|nr:Smr/MutS family protein [Kineococcus radiotolerans]ABS01854.1 Smr protein/MutS2 [Kineococcus radiotolerans SRS30216 = ATCC BAA-149]